MFGWHFCWKHRLLWHDRDEECQICWAEKEELKRELLLLNIDWR